MVPYCVATVLLIATALRTRFIDILLPASDLLIASMLSLTHRHLAAMGGHAKVRLLCLRFLVRVKSNTPEQVLHMHMCMQARPLPCMRPLSVLHK